MDRLSAKEIKQYKDMARRIRKDILDMIYHTKSPHIGSSLSIVEILTALYFRVLSVSPDRYDSQDRDKFILSKGHACPALYATLFQRGFINKRILKGFAVESGTLEHHPRRNVSMGIEVTTGSLGHGLSLGIGMSIAARHNKTNEKVFALLSDGEMNEGSVWEGIMFASQHGLDRLVAIIDYNKMQALGKTEDIVGLEPLSEKLRAFGWGVYEINGHDFDEIVNAFAEIPFSKGKPSAVIAHTVLGQGISFMQGRLRWHYDYPNKSEYAKAMKELSKI